MKQLLLILILFCAPLAAEPLVVAVSVPAQKTLVKEIAKDRVQVITLIPSKANPHTYTPKPSQLVELNKAKLYFAIGAEFSFEQTWMDRITGINPNIKIVNTSKGITIHDDHDHPDPHFWLSPLSCKIGIKNITEALIQADPTAKDFYQKNHTALDAKLDTLHSWITKTLEPLNPRIIIVHHPAWTHYAHDYNLKQIAIEQHGKDPTPRHMAHTIELAKKHNIRTIFIQNPQEFASGSANTVAREIGARIHHIDPTSYVGHDNANIKAFFERVTKAIAFQQSKSGH